MKNVVLFLILYLLPTIAFGQQKVTPAQDPTAIGNAFFKALLDEDDKVLGTIISDDLDVISFDGQSIDGNLFIQNIAGGIFTVETGVVTDAVTRQYNNDAAVMTGIWQAKGSIDGQGFDSTVAFSVVSAKQAGVWKIVTVQFTPVSQ
ncbi:nuclear transport factor 2 family protein [Spirosoma sp.]|uniref:nuclear transport factor 2 family protein n=1 Tax=Spirosoma sp. TaxID=1899569 RepID=UPI002602DBF4|nr:nuclear transport factor 2 family protein [Spirosoma sp.]MCX6213917.1 nuclear transport factor 2 family protein [Spirosoma sp.]